MKGLWLHWAWVPVVNFLVGLATIVVLLVLWLAAGAPQYQPDNYTVVYISDVGSAHHRVFMGLAIPTAVLFFASIVLDLQLRHIRRLPHRQRKRERFWAFMSTVFAFGTMVFCILLSVFDNLDYSNIHWAFAIVFFLCLIVTGVSKLAEIAYLSRDYKDHGLLRASFVAKLIIIVLGVAALISIGAIVGVCSRRDIDGVDRVVTCDRPMSGVAALEWFLAVLFLAYIGSLVLDLYPSRYTSKHIPHTQPDSTLMTSNSAYKQQQDPEAAQPVNANGVQMGGTGGVRGPRPSS